MLKTACNENTMEITQTSEWYSQFKCAGKSINECEHSFHPCKGSTDKNIEKVCQVQCKDCQSAISEFAGRSGLSYGTRHCILGENLKMWQISVISAHQLQTNEQKHWRFLGTKNTDAAPHPLYLPDLAPVICPCIREGNQTKRVSFPARPKIQEEMQSPPYTKSQKVSSVGASSNSRKA